MKILMVSIFAPHFFNWTEQLRDSGHEIYWLDVFDSNTKVQKIDFANQITGWRYRWNFPGRYFLKKNAPGLTRIINGYNERDLQVVLNEKLEEINPDVVHSFVMYLSTAPILEVMKKFPQIKWIYSSWGSDLYFYRNSNKELAEMKQTLPEVDYMFADCRRDHEIAVEHGFSGDFLGVFPGGGGFDFQQIDTYIKPVISRNTMVIKGYQGRHGKCICVLKALVGLREELKDFRIIVFGAAKEVQDFVSYSTLNEWNNLEVRTKIPHSEVLSLMGSALIYIGNSSSDGTPNTLLEAMIMGAYPIQSNPGGATAEWIRDGVNGRLIQDPQNVEEIRELIQLSLSQKESVIKGILYNLEKIRPSLERETIRTQVLKQYSLVEENLNSKKYAARG